MIPGCTCRNDARCQVVCTVPGCSWCGENKRPPDPVPVGSLSGTADSYPTVTRMFGGGTAAYGPEWRSVPMSSEANTAMISMTPQQRVAFLQEIARGYHLTVRGCGHSVHGIGPSGDCSCRPEPPSSRLVGVVVDAAERAALAACDECKHEHETHDVTAFGDGKARFVRGDCPIPDCIHESEVRRKIRLASR